MIFLLYWIAAIRMSVYTCQQQFEYERWNCTLNGFSRILTLKKGQTASLLHAQDKKKKGKILKPMVDSRILQMLVWLVYTYAAYKETAALYAFSAAGVAHAVARACAAGRLRKCHCAEADNEVETRQTWRWGGCGDNLAYGRSFAMKFLDSGSTAKVRPSGGGKSDSRPHTNPDSKLNKKNKVSCSIIK